MKKFWKRTEGFTLVELIVVIAILGILAGIGTVGYSGYVKKANMAADQQLVSQVANALQIYYYSNPTKAASDYVVLTTENADHGQKGFVDPAMIAAFGEGWKDSLKLSYNGWTDDGMLDYVLANKDDAVIIAKSSYMTNSTPGEMIKTVSKLTGALGNLAATASKDPLDTLSSLGTLPSEQAAAIKAELAGDKYKLSWTNGGDNTAYATALSNILVKHVADEMDAVEDPEQMSLLSTMASQYALIYAWSTTSAEGATALANLNAEITAPDADTKSIMEAFGALEFGEDYEAYFLESGLNDYNAAFSIMSAVSDISDDYDMTVSGLYTSDAVVDQLNNYVGAVTAVGNLEDDTDVLDDFEDGDVVVFITDAGRISVVPAAVYVAG